MRRSHPVAMSAGKCGRTHVRCTTPYLDRRLSARVDWTVPAHVAKRRKHLNLTMRAHGSGQAPKAKVRSLALAVCAVVLAETSACGLLSPNDVKPDPDHPVLAIGSPAPDFSLAGADGKTHGLKEYGDTRVLAIVFQCNHCPASELYEGRINKLYKDYRNKGVA